MFLLPYMDDLGLYGTLPQCGLRIVNMPYIVRLGQGYNLLVSNLNQLLTHCQHLFASSEIEGEQGVEQGVGREGGVDVGSCMTVRDT